MLLNSDHCKSKPLFRVNGFCLALVWWSQNPIIFLGRELVTILCNVNDSIMLWNNLILNWVHHKHVVLWFQSMSAETYSNRKIFGSCWKKHDIYISVEPWRALNSMLCFEVVTIGKLKVTYRLTQLLCWGWLVEMLGWEVYLAKCCFVLDGC